MKFFLVVFCLIAMRLHTVTACFPAPTPCQISCEQELEKGSRNCERAVTTSEKKLSYYYACRLPIIEVYEKCMEDCKTQEIAKREKLRSERFFRR